MLAQKIKKKKSKNKIVLKFWSYHLSFKTPRRRRRTSKEPARDGRPQNALVWLPVRHTRRRRRRRRRRTDCRTVF